MSEKGNITSVLQKPALSLDEMVGSIVLYAILGTGQYRDRSLTIDVLKQWISNNFNSIKIDLEQDKGTIYIDKDGIRLVARGSKIFEISSDKTRLSNLNCFGESTFEGTSTFKENVVFEKIVEFIKGVSFNSAISVLGDSLFSGNAQVKGNSFFDKDVTIGLGITAYGKVHIFGPDDLNRVVFNNGSIQASKSIRSGGEVSGTSLSASSFVKIPIHDAANEQELNNPAIIASVSAIQNLSVGATIAVRNNSGYAININRIVPGGNQQMNLVINNGECISYVYNGSSWFKVW